MPKTSSGGVTQRRHAEASRRGVTQRRHAERSRRRSTYLCYALLCYASMGGVVAGACDAGSRPTATITAADTADQVLDSMSHYVTTAGIMRAHLRADTAYFYSPMQTAELRVVHITFYDPHGAETSTRTGCASRATTACGAGAMRRSTGATSPRAATRCSSIRSRGSA